MDMLIFLHAARLCLILAVRRHTRTAACIGLFGLLIGAAMPAWAQLGGVRLGVPTLPSFPNFPNLPIEPRLLLPQSVNTALGGVSLQQLRQTTVRDLLRQHSDLLEADPMGEPIRRAELVLVSPAPGVVEAALVLGFVQLRAQFWPELGLQEVVLRPPASLSTVRALAVLRGLQPDVEADFNHIYTPSGEAGIPGAAARTPVIGPVRVGLIDGGLDAQHPAFKGHDLHLWGCQGAPVPSVHGTAVASLLIGPTAAPQTPAALYAADIYCGKPAGGAAEDLASAMAWMARERVAVINVSLVGPANRVLERSVQALIRQGYVVVAAVGNDGPAAAPLYPASYVGVVGVTGVSPAPRVLPEAAQGPQVMFAALGAQVSAAQIGGGYATVRGTSFAAPRVAALLARQLPQPDVVMAQAAVAHLASVARDLGAPGRDTVYGWGLVGTDKP